MPSVKNVQIHKMADTDNTYYASWEFDGGYKASTTTTVSNVSVGDLVRVNQGAKWWNGATIVSDVFNDIWVVYQVDSNGRVVINKNQSGTRAIMSPISATYLTKVNSGGGTSSGGTTESITTVDHYDLMWSYMTEDGIPIHGKDATHPYPDTSIFYDDATYNPPEQAIRIGLIVTPVSKTYQVNGQETSYWTGTPSARVYYDLTENHYTPDKPNAPTLEIDGTDLTVSLDNINDSKAEYIQFEIYQGTSLYRTVLAKVSAAYAEYKCTVNAGGMYRARCRARYGQPFGESDPGSDVPNIDIGDTYYVFYSEWSDFSSSVATVPVAPTGFTAIRAASSTSVYLAWNAIESADTYDIEYTTNPTYFQGSNATTIQSGIETTQYTLTGLESGDEYYFRVRAVNDQGHSDWSSIASVIIGKAPAAPTTWSSATTVIVGDPLNLYWVHNAEDGSWETYAQIEMWIRTDPEGEFEKQAVQTIESDQTDDPDDDSDTEKTHVYEVDTTDYAEGFTLRWRVRTAGITKEFGDWSILREVNIYAQPTLSLNLTNQNGETFTTLTQFPFSLSAFAGPATQEPIGYHVTIISLSSYETVDTVGEPKIVNVGEEVYSRYFDTNEQLNVTFMPSDVDFVNSANYRLTVIVSMNSGLTAESTREFDVAWTEEQYEPDTEIALDKTAYVTYLTPYCRDEDGVPVPNVLLSIYRREFDGTYTEIATGLSSESNTVVTDPHPSLDYARYRVVAISQTTGAVSYYDTPGYPVGGKCVILQWDEEWKVFDTTNPDRILNPMWDGTLLKIYGNIDVADNSTPDVSLVNYLGRTYPVSYYSTAIDSTSTWNMEIPKTDKETLFQLRRLQIWKGDVYVREPSGSGYWANVAVSFSQKHLETTIPVTLDITRVEGGM